MALSLSARLGLTRWSEGTDPLSRAQLDRDHERLDIGTAIDSQVQTLADRQPAGVRGRFCFVIENRTLWRDTGVRWDQVSQSDISGSPLLQRLLAKEKNAADPPSTYPQGLSTFDTSSLGGWPAVNLQVTTQRTPSRATQTLSQIATGRTWVRTQNGANADTWGRFTEVVETLRFTSTTRPEVNLFDGMRGYETDTTGTVVWSAGANRWLYESFLNPPYWEYRGAEHGMVAGDWPVQNKKRMESRMVVGSGSDLNYPGSYVTILVPGWYQVDASLRVASSRPESTERLLIIQQERTGARHSRRCQHQFKPGESSHTAGGLFRLEQYDRIIVLFWSLGEMSATDNLLENQFNGRWISNL